MNPQIFEVILDKLNQGGPIVIDNPMVSGTMISLRNE
jgi:predicted O-methyltransferase YrrM